jgi:hypothetical protein
VQFKISADFFLGGEGAWKTDPCTVYFTFPRYAKNLKNKAKFEDLENFISFHTNKGINLLDVP